MDSYLLNLFIESIVVGLYVSFIFYILRHFINSNDILLSFLVGFVKHFMGYYIGIQHLFCIFRKKNKILYPTFFLIQCILEGFVFVFVFLIIKNPFLCGMLIHLTAEYLGIHKMFVKGMCR